MTRWARSGNTQKHKKPPEDPTPWEEFSKQKRLKSNLNNRPPKNKKNECAQSSSNVKAIEHQSKTLEHPILNKCLATSDTVKEQKSSNKKRKRKLLSQDDLATVETNPNHNFDADTDHAHSVQAIKVDPDTRHIATLHTNEYDTVIEQNEPLKANEDDEVMQTSTKSLLQKKKNKHQSQINELVTSETGDIINSDGNTNLEEAEDLKSEVKDNVDQTDNSGLKSPKETSLKLIKHEKEKFFDRLKRKRADNGITLLPPKIERKLYHMKKGLRNKGVPGENIKEMIREIRRKEELKFRKTFKTCYKCRQMGHVMSDCPLLNTDNEEGTGICFKCGSTEHTSYRCSIKKSDFPFAKCFICHEQGHLSRVCPKNKHGAYPKGGECNLCGSINHLKKDCPTLKNKDEEELTVGMFNAGTSVEEIEDSKPLPSIVKKLKIVKF